jgi:hypothetical protein
MRPLRSAPGKALNVVRVGGKLLPILPRQALGIHGSDSFSAACRIRQQQIFAAARG